nr:EamA family transporter [Clostridium sp. Ade.TY]
MCGFFYAFLSAIFATLTSILAKIGIFDINSNLSTTIRAVVILILTLGIIFSTGSFKGIKNISNKSMIFLILSRLVTGLSWLFYYKAIQVGQVTKVIAIDKLSIIITIILTFFILNETLNIKSNFGGLLIFLRTIFITLKF